MSQIVADCQPLTANFTEFCHELHPEEAFFTCFLDQAISAYQALAPYVNSLAHVSRLVKDRTLRKVIFEHIKQDLLPVITKTCVYELHEAKANGYLTEKTSEARFEQFIALLKEPENIQAILNKYPVLARLLKTYLKQYIESMKQFFEALNLVSQFGHI